MGKVSKAITDIDDLIALAESANDFLSVTRAVTGAKSAYRAKSMGNWRNALGDFFA